MDKFYLGVDGGQSSTVALIADSTGRILGHGRGGPCNHVAASEGRDKFFRAIGECLRLAGMEAGVDPRIQEFASVCLGFSGGAEDKVAYSKELIKGARYLITHDAEIALTGATAGEPGIIVIAGTGSIAFGRNKEGKTARAGGWGYIFGDEGGAFDLARKALRAALRMEEGWGSASILRDMLLQATQASSASKLLHSLYGNFDRAAIARLAPLVSSAAEQGDKPAIEILQEAARDLAALVFGVNRMLFGGDSAAIVSFVGGAFESPILRHDFMQLVKTRMNIEPASPLYPPAAGAVIQALRADANNSVLSNLPDIKQ